MKHISKVELELINEKPHFGLWMGRSVILNRDVDSVNLECPVVKMALGMLKEHPYGNDIQIRHEEVIFRPSYLCNDLKLNATLGVKFVIWGRAYRVMSLLSKKTKRTKKSYVCGRRRRVSK